MLPRRWSVCLVACLWAGAAGCVQMPLLSGNDPKEKAIRAEKKDRDKDKEKEMPRTREVFQEQIKLKPDTLVSHAQFCEQTATEREDPGERDRLREKARKSYLRALEVDKHHAPALIGLARLMESMGRHDRAQEYYAEALKVRPRDASIWVEVGMVHARNKEWDWSMECLRRGMEMDPDNKQYRKTYGLALARAGRYDDSMAQLRKCASEAEAHCMIARMLHHMGQEDSARARVQQALQADPNLAAAKSLQEELNGQGAVEQVSHEEVEPAKPAE